MHWCGLLHRNRRHYVKLSLFCHKRYLSISPSVSIWVSGVSKSVMWEPMTESIIKCRRSCETVIFRTSMLTMFVKTSFSPTSMSVWMRVILTLMPPLKRSRIALWMLPIFLRRTFKQSNHASHNRWFDRECFIAKKQVNRYLRIVLLTHTNLDTVVYIRHRNTSKCLLQQKKSDFRHSTAADVNRNAEDPNMFGSRLRV